MLAFPSRLLAFCSLVVFVACTSTTSTVPGVIDHGVDPADPSDDGGADAPAASAHVVQVTNFAYTPAQLTINVGETVEWVWKSGTHTVSSGADCAADKQYESGLHSAPFTFRHTFTEVGTMNYFCDYMEHCAMGQVGTIKVVAP